MKMIHIQNALLEFSDVRKMYGNFWIWLANDILSKTKILYEINIDLLRQVACGLECLHNK